MKTVYLKSEDNMWEMYEYENLSDLDSEFDKRYIQIGKFAEIGENTKIGKGAKIGDDAIIGEGTRIGDGANIGYGTVVCGGARVTLEG